MGLDRKDRFTYGMNIKKSIVNSFLIFRSEINDMIINIGEM